MKLLCADERTHVAPSRKSRSLTIFITAGLYRRQRLITPKGAATRPTSSQLRQALFNICQSCIEGARFLDVFAGSGAMGLEALSRGAQSATFIESDKEAIRCIQANIDHLGVPEQSMVLRGSVFTMLAKIAAQSLTFDIIYADPPYATCLPHTSQLYSSALVLWVDTHQILAPQGSLFIEESARLAAPLTSLQNLQFKDQRRLGQASLSRYVRLP